VASVNVRIQLAEKKNMMIKFFGFLVFLLALIFSETVFGSEAQIKSFCKKNYGKKLTTYNQCVLSQKSAEKFIKNRKTDKGIKHYCEKWNPINWVKRKYCITSQEKAKLEIESIKTDPIIKYTCEVVNNEDLVLQRNCILEEIEGKD
jgi:glutathione peroxidase-family protein